MSIDWMWVFVGLGFVGLILMVVAVAYATDTLTDPYERPPFYNWEEHGDGHN